ncbi:MAG: hypothetical protein ACYSTS_19380 [Planctomycetota bacterium]|jgi:hypothetical protein
MINKVYSIFKEDGSGESKEGESFKMLNLLEDRLLHPGYVHGSENPADPD